MMVRSLSDIKLLFEDGDIPTGQDFTDLIDSIASVVPGVITVGDSGCQYDNLTDALSANGNVIYLVVGNLSSGATINEACTIYGLNAMIQGSIIIESCNVALNKLNITGYLNINTDLGSSIVYIDNCKIFNQCNWIVTDPNLLTVVVNNSNFYHSGLFHAAIDLSGDKASGARLEFNHVFVNGAGVGNSGLSVGDVGGSTVLYQLYSRFLFCEFTSSGSGFTSTVAITPNVYLSYIKTLSANITLPAGGGNVVI